MGVHIKTAASRDEADQDIDEALAHHAFPIQSAASILIAEGPGAQEVAKILFHALVEKLAAHLKQELVIYFCKDSKGRECLSVLPNQPSGIQLYGVRAEEFDFPNMHPIKRTMQ